MKKLTFILLLLSPCVLLSQTPLVTNQDSNIGSNLGDFDSYDSISADGKTIAVTIVKIEKDYQGKYDKRSYIRTYNKKGNEWVKTGQDLLRVKSSLLINRSVSLSGDGNVIAIASLVNNKYPDNYSVDVEIYKKVVGKWQQVGDIIYGETLHGFNESSVKISSDGTTVNFAAWKYGDGEPLMKVYKYVDGAWKRMNSFRNDFRNQYIKGDFNFDTDPCQPKLGNSYGVIYRLKIIIAHSSDLLPPNERHKRLSATYLAKVIEVDGEKLDEPLIFDFDCSGYDCLYPKRDDELYELFYGKEAYENNYDPKKLEKLKKKYLGKEYYVFAYESGRFTGLPKNYMEVKYSGVKFKPGEFPIRPGGVPDFHFNNYIIIDGAFDKKTLKKIPQYPNRPIIK